MRRLNALPLPPGAGLTRRRALHQLAGLSAATVALDTGAAQAAAQPSQRLVSIGGALTEIVYALGAGADLVGVDTTSTFPEAARTLPQVGYARALSAEGVLALAPSRILATEDAGPPAVLRQLSAAGVPLSVLPARHRFEGMLERVRRVGEFTGRTVQAGQLTQRLHTEWQAVRQKIDSHSGRPPRVLFLLTHNPSQAMVSGRDTQADAMLAYAGAVNVIDGFSGYKPLTPEVVIAARPDAVLLTEQGLRAAGGPAGVLRLPGLAQTPAGRAQRIVALEAMFLLGFGPRLPAAVQALDGALRKAAA